MKVLSLLLLTVSLSFNSFSTNSLASEEKCISQKNSDDELKVSLKNLTVEFVLHSDIESESGLIKIKSSNGTNILSEEVEVISGKCFKWIYKDTLKPGNYSVILIAEEGEFETSFTIK